MDTSTMLWMIALMITHLSAYFWGRSDNNTDAPSEEAWIAVKEYEIDKRYAHLCYIREKQAEERRREHEKGDDGSSKGPKA